MIVTSGASATWCAYAQAQAKARSHQAVVVIYVVITPFMLTFFRN